MKKVNILLAVIVSLLAVSLMLLNTDMAQKVQRSVMSLLSPVQRTGSAVKEGLGAMGKGLKTLDELEDDNRRLERENKELRASNQILRDIEA